MYDKLVLVTRKTRLEGLVERFNTKGQAKFYIEHSSGNFELYEQEHATYYAALSRLQKALQGLLKVQVVERSFLPNFFFSPADVVVVLGIDGLVVNTAKYLTGQPLVAVNPDPRHIDGLLLPFEVGNAPTAVGNVLTGKHLFRAVTMTEATLNDGQTLLAFNDLFIGRHDHASARYHIESHGRGENQSSSGVIVSTGAGATGWLSSLFNMANGLLDSFGQGDGQAVPPTLEWNSEKLVYVVREPFISKTSAAGMVCGVITADSPLRLESHMPEGGVIFSDGVKQDYLPFNAGSLATIGLAAQKTNLVVAN